MGEWGNGGTVPGGMSILEGCEPIAGGATTSDEGRPKLVRFFSESVNRKVSKNPQLVTEVHPELCFVALLDHNTDLGNEFFSRPGSIGSAVVGCDRRGGANQLTSYIL